MSHIFTVCTYYCHKLLEPPSQIVTLFFILYQALPNAHYNHYLHNEYVEVWQGGA